MLTGNHPRLNECSNKRKGNSPCHKKNREGITSHTAAWFPLFAMPFHARGWAKNNKKIQRLAQTLACLEKSHYLCTEKSVGIPTKVLV